jgi:hypothetical protein
VIQASPMIAAPQIGNINKDDAKNKTWNGAMNLQLVNCCLAHKAYKKSDETYENKWKIVTANLMLKPEFKGRELVPSNVKRKFDRLKEDVEKKYGISGK